MPQRPTDKPTILVCSDSSLLHTGLGRVTRSIFTRLAERYTIIQHGWQHPIHSVESVPYQIVPTMTNAEGTGWDPSDAYGQKSFVHAVEQYKPDIVWVCADPWRIGHFVENQVRNKYRLVGYCAIDSAPLRPEWIDALSKLDFFVPYCQWAKDVVEAHGLTNTTEPIGHGVDTHLFLPIEQSEINQLRRNHLHMEDDNVVLGSFGRNMSRKGLTSVIQALHYLVHGDYFHCGDCGRLTLWKWDRVRRKNVGEAPTQCDCCGSKDIIKAEPRPEFLWYFHGPLIDVMGWDLPGVADTFEVFSNCRFNPALQVGRGQTDLVMNRLYNACDVYVHPAICEGWGLPILEAMSAGRPCILNDAPAYGEWAEPGALMVKSHEFIQETLCTSRFMIDVSDLISKVLMVADDKDLRTKLSRAARSQAMKFAWDDIVNQWIVLFDGIVAEGRVPPWQRLMHL